MQSVLLLERKEQKSPANSGFEEKSPLMENSGGYRMMSDFSLSPDTCLSLALWMNLDCRTSRESSVLEALGRDRSS